MRIDPVRYSGAPVGERRPNEMAVYAFLDKLAIPYDRCDHDYANTMEDCKAIEGVLEAPICKNLLLTNRKQTDFYLLMMPGDKPFRTKDVTGQLGCARLSFATPEHMERLLGAAPGSASAFELIHDGEGKVQLVLNKELLSQTWISGHPCYSTSTIRVKLADFLEKFLPAVHHQPVVVELPWPETE